MSLNERFKQQLDDNNHAPLTKEKLGTLKGQGMYGPYEVGDVPLFWMDEVEGSDGTSIVFSVRTVANRELPKMEKDFEFVRMGGSGNLPVFKRITKGGN
jgi:hypothetical protein